MSYCAFPDRPKCFMVDRNCLPATFFDVFEEDPSLKEYNKQRWLFTLIRKQNIPNLHIACDVTYNTA